MFRSDLILNQKFWSVLKFIATLEKEIPLKDIFGNLPFSEDEVFKLIEFLKSENYEVKFSKDKGVNVLLPPKNTLKRNFSVLESLVLNLNPKNKYKYKHKYKLINRGALNNLHLSEILYDCLREHRCVDIDLVSGESIKIFPHRPVYIDGVISLLGEECEEGKLIYFKIDDISSASGINFSYTPKYTYCEVSEFISALRTMNGNDVRLVLKVYAHANPDMAPEYHYFANPFVTSNFEGEKVWAASVEPSDALYDWLFSIKEDIEILDPPSIERGLVEYSLKFFKGEKRK